MQIRDALAYGRQTLAESPTPALDARLLLQFVLQKDHVFLIAHDDTELSETEQQQYRALIERARQGEPIPYLTGQAPFYGRMFQVSPAVLIPRPETEELVTAAIEWARKRPPTIQIVDVGTGSGCIAVTLAHALPGASITAVDLSTDALAVARENTRQHGLLERINFRQGNLLAPITDPIDLIVANLPYVSDTEWTMLDDAVKLYEPSLALKGGANGLELIQQLLDQARTYLRPGGAIFLEIGWQQGTSALAVAQEVWPAARVELRLDTAGQDRIIIVETD